METNVIDKLGMIDICMVLDSTASMQPFIDDAKRHAKQIAQDIAEKGDLHLRVGLIAFRDHPPQDHTYVTRKVDFSDLGRFQVAVDALGAYGGGDVPEAVYDGLYAAAGLQWREGAEHLVYLIGDAPPHGVGYPGDGFPGGCPCELTARGIIEVFSMHRLTLHACAIGGDPTTVKEFGELAEACYGKLFKIDVTMPHMVSASFERTLTATSGSITSSRAVWAASASGATTMDEYVSATGLNANEVTASMNYLDSRGYSVPLGDVPLGDIKISFSKPAAGTKDADTKVTPPKKKHLRSPKPMP